jgi:hypothetical protein
MGLPAIGRSGFGMVKVCGRKREPRPAMGIITFMEITFGFYKFVSFKDYELLSTLNAISSSNDTNL